MASGYSISLGFGSNMLDLEKISWGPGILGYIVAGQFIAAASTTPGQATIQLVGIDSFTNSPTFQGAVSGTLNQGVASWGTGSLILSSNVPTSPISGVVVGNSNSTLQIDWQSFLGGDDTFDQGYTQEDVIDGGGGVNTVVYSDRSSTDATITKVGNAVQIKTFSATDTLISIQKVKFADKTIDIGNFSSPAISVVDTSTGQPVAATSQRYSGPVAGIQQEYINITSANLNISAATDNWFVHSGSGTDAIATHGGTNVLDGGTGSNFLTGGPGTDTFFVDDRSAGTDIWSTVANFSAGDSATVWGLTPADFSVQWVDGQGAAGFAGLTLHATNPQKPVASLTLVGFSTADITSGRLATVFGTDSASGSPYLFIHANS
jgi:hypothetical protein